MAERLDDRTDEDSCSFCGSSPVVMSRPTLIGRGHGLLRAFWRTCSDCERIPERRSPRSSRYYATTPTNPWSDR
jgi:hypothetical protein